jgi:hypothetical protein
MLWGQGGEPSTLVAAGLGGWHAAPGMVDRRTATLMYAGRNRRSATRRKVPLTKRAPAWPAQSTHGDRSCSDGAPARRAAGGHPGADPGGDRWPVAMSGRHLGHRKPASSRAIAVAARFLESLWAASRPKRPHSRSWAAQARATT